jgi:transposase InsO family protein
VFGISKQAYHQRIVADKQREQEQEIVLKEVAKIRRRMPQTGTRKLYEKLQRALQEHDIKMGRDALFDLLRYKGLLVRKTKCFHITTDSKHFYYTSPNLIKELEIKHSEQVFVNDITYIKTDEGHAYLAQRINGILKYEFGLRKTIASIAIARAMIKEAVDIYNNERLHWSLDLKTPQIVHAAYNQQKYKSYKREAA